ncbi:enolase C-terminal domain-like protein [Pontibacter ruber]|uniref:Enolase C-terminal domain-like protein n=1 Tax=Pontibacter ruber TaxID=1343895 RepID=A0ABW5CW53_9BACT|nr:enolase C-terminal domain-like protein [Pontibacter ruber]
MLNWRIEALHLKLKYPLQAGSSAGSEKTNFLLQVTDGTYSGFGEAAPCIRFGETNELLLQQYQVLLMAGLPSITSMEDLLQLLLEHTPVNSLRFAIESAYLHFFCQHKGIAIHQLLGQSPPKPHATCYTLPFLEPGSIKDFIRVNNLNRFRSLKVNVSPGLAEELVREVMLASSRPLVLDGNESWHDPEELLHFLEWLDPKQVLFVEQPMPASSVVAYAHLKGNSPVPLVADESIIDEADFELLREQFHGVNIKLMKAGGYVNTVRLLAEARKHGMMTMLGCTTETTLGIWSGMQLCHAFDFTSLDGFLLLEDEPFKLVREENGILYLK